MTREHSLHTGGGEERKKQRLQRPQRRYFKTFWGPLLTVIICRNVEHVGSAAATACLGERLGEREWETERDEVWLRKEVLKTKSEGIILAGVGGGCRAWQPGSGLQMWVSEQRRAASTERRASERWVLALRMSQHFPRQVVRERRGEKELRPRCGRPRASLALALFWGGFISSVAGASLKLEGFGGAVGKKKGRLEASWCVQRHQGSGRVPAAVTHSSELPE